jgi:hypothetical protein
MISAGRVNKDPILKSLLFGRNPGIAPGAPVVLPDLDVLAGGVRQAMDPFTISRFQGSNGFHRQR